MGKKTKNILSLSIITILMATMGILLILNHQNNNTDKKHFLTKANMDGSEYKYDDISISISPRGGSTGSWTKDPIYDDNDNMIHGASVGTIYEVYITNNSKEVVSDWKITIPINEKMWINNSWNSNLEIHQDVKNNENVMAIDLADYKDYDITLDYYIDHTGPMIPLYKGDYFIYLPEKNAKELPISQATSDSSDKPTVSFGFIMYLPDKNVDYIADFSGGEIIYRLYTNPAKQWWFWTLISLMFIWLVFMIITIIVRIKMKRLVAAQQERKEHDEIMIKQTMQLIINMIETKDTSTKGHSLRVADYSKKIAEKMGYSEDDAMNIYYIGLLHDCGKVNIPDSILKNPGKLSDEEYAVMKKHPVYGSDILKDFSSIADIDIGAKYHHERFDGKGYPSGLKGEEIPLIARIIGVADAFDAMNSKRCYRDKLPSDYIMNELINNKGKQFDPNMVDYLIELINEGSIEF